MFVEERLPITLRFDCKAKTDLTHVRYGAKDVHLPGGNGATDLNASSSKGFNYINVHCTILVRI